MMALKFVSPFLVLHSIQASPVGYKVEEYTNDNNEVEEDEDWSAEALKGAKKQTEADEDKVQNMMQKAEFAGAKGLQMNQADISEFAELVEEESPVSRMHSKLTHLEKMAALQSRWKELAAELHAARIEEFMDETLQMPKTLLGLEAEVARLENVKKVEEMAKEAEDSTPRKSNLLQIGSSSARFEQAARERRFTATQTDLANLKSKVEAADATVADSMRALDKASKALEAAHEALEDSDKLWKDAEMELRTRDKQWAQKEREHLEQEYNAIVALKDGAEKKLEMDKIAEEELSGQQMLTIVSVAMQEAHKNSATLESFTETLTKELEKNEFDVDDFVHYAKKEKNPKHLTGWGLFKRGPAGIAAEPLAAALKQLDVNADDHQLAAKLYAASA